MRAMLAAIAHPHQHRWLKLRPFQRHSLVLVVAGLVYLALGSTFILSDPVPNRTAALKAVLLFMPLKSWGVVWIGHGLLALLSARWPPASKTWGYSVLAIPSLVWSSGYLIGAVCLDAPASAYAGSLIFGLMAFMWWAIAGLDNPDDVMTRVADALADRRRETGEH